MKLEDIKSKTKDGVSGELLSGSPNLPIIELSTTPRLQGFGIDTDAIVNGRSNPTLESNPMRPQR